MKLYIDGSILNRKDASKKAHGTKEPRVNDDVLQLGGALSTQLNHDKTHWPNPVVGSGVACQLCLWASIEKVH